MAGCQINGRLWYELYRNTPLEWLWKMVEHTPAGDSLMWGESYKVIQRRIVELSGLDPAEVSRECDRLRAAKALSETRQRRANAVVPPVEITDPRCVAGGAFTCSLLEEAA